MIMAMLAAGGMRLVQDEERKADIHNPKGYYEDSRVVSLNLRSNWLSEAVDRAVKITAYLLQFLPGFYHYRVIYIDRAIEEVVLSQEKMLKGKGLNEHAYSSASSKKLLKEHNEGTKEWLRCQDNMDVLFLNYAVVLEVPVNTASVIAHFLSDHRLNALKMSDAIDSGLYRNKVEQESVAPTQHSDHCAKCLKQFLTKAERGWTLKKDGKLKDYCIRCMLIEAANGTL
jgi:hypothetical protein